MHFKKNQKPSSSSSISALTEHTLFERRESRNFHNTYEEEQRMLSLIRSGDVQHLPDHPLIFTGGCPGILSRNQLRQEQNLLSPSLRWSQEQPSKADSRRKLPSLSATALSRRLRPHTRRRKSAGSLFRPCRLSPRKWPSAGTEAILLRWNKLSIIFTGTFILL